MAVEGFNKLISLLPNWNNVIKENIRKSLIAQNVPESDLNFILGKIDSYVADKKISETEIQDFQPWFIKNADGSEQNKWLLEVLTQNLKSNLPLNNPEKIDQYLAKNKIESFGLASLNNENKELIAGSEKKIKESASLIKIFAVVLAEKDLKVNGKNFRINLDDELLADPIGNAEGEKEDFKTVRECINSICSHSSNTAFNKLVYHIGHQACKQANKEASPENIRAEFNELLKQIGIKDTKFQNFLSFDGPGDIKGTGNETTISDLMKVMRLVYKNPSLNKFIKADNIEDSCKIEYNGIKNLGNKIGLNSKVFGNLAVIKKDGEEYITVIVDRDYANETDESGQKKLDNINNNNSNNCFLAEATEEIITQGGVKVF